MNNRCLAEKFKGGSVKIEKVGRVGNKQNSESIVMNGVTLAKLEKSDNSCINEKKRNCAEEER